MSRSVHGKADLTVSQWGWSLLRAERMTILYLGIENRYYGLKILGFKILFWHSSFDRSSTT